MSNEVFEAHTKLKTAMQKAITDGLWRFTGKDNYKYIVLSCIYESAQDAEYTACNAMPFTYHQKHKIGEVIDDWYLSFKGHIEHDSEKFEIARDSLKSLLLGADWGYQ